MHEDMIKIFKANMKTIKVVLPILAEKFQIKSLNPKDFLKLAIVIAGNIKENESKLVLICDKRTKRKYFKKNNSIFRLQFDNDERIYEYFIDTYENIKEKILKENEVYCKMYNMSTKLYDPSKRFTKMIEKLNKVKEKNIFMRWIISKFI